MKLPDSTVVLERQLLLQLGDRLKSLRKARDLGTVEVAKRAGISRTTLSSVESGDPGPAIETYLRVMSVLGISGELALLAGDALQPGPTGTAAARSKRARPVVQVTVSTDDSRHQLQDLQSLALHEEAIRLARVRPFTLHGLVAGVAGDSSRREVAQGPGANAAGAGASPGIATDGRAPGADASRRAGAGWATAKGRCVGRF